MPGTQIDKYQIILNTQGTDLRTKKEQTTQLRGEKRPHPKRLEVRSCGLGDKQITGVVEGREHWLWREAHACARMWEECTGVCTRKILPQSHWLGQKEGLIFVSFCNQWGSKTWVLEAHGMAGIEPWGCCSAPGKMVPTFWSASEKGGISFLGQRNWWVPFSFPAPQHRCRDTC